MVMYRRQDGDVSIGLIRVLITMSVLIIVIGRAYYINKTKEFRDRAEVTTATVTEITAVGKSINVSYSYTVDGVVYVNADRTDDIIAVGQDVKVWYDPEHHENVVMDGIILNGDKARKYLNSR